MVTMIRSFLRSTLQLSSTVQLQRYISPLISPKITPHIKHHMCTSHSPSYNTNINCSHTNINISINNHLPKTFFDSARWLSSTAARPDLMEFFDNENNWGAKKVRVGRQWLKDELRLKSNDDLHKLWFEIHYWLSFLSSRPNLYYFT